MIGCTPLVSLTLAGSLGAATLGCESKFTRDHLRTLELGKSSPTQAKSMLGNPMQSELIDEPAFKGELYIYQDLTPNPFRGESNRFAYLEFLRDRLNAYTFWGVSSSDQSPADAAAGKALEARRATRNDVLAQLGEPAGKALPGTRLNDFKPLFTPGVTEVWQYLEPLPGGGSLKVKQLFVCFGASGTVTATASREITRRM